MIAPLGGQAEIRDKLRAGIVLVRLPIVDFHAAAVAQGLQQARGAGVLGPALVDDAVAQEVLGVVGVGPGCDGGVRVVGVVVDVADLDVAFGVRGGDGGRGGEGGAGEGRGVGVEDDLVAGLDPGVVPLDDAGGLLPAGFGLAALVGGRVGVDGGGDDVAAFGVVHDLAGVQPSVVAAAAARGAVACVDVGWVRLWGSSVLAAHVEDVCEGVETLLRGDVGGTSTISTHGPDGRHIFDLAVLLRVCQGFVEIAVVAKSVYCSEALRITQRWCIVIGAKIAPSLIDVRRRNHCLTTDQGRCRRNQEGKQGAALLWMHVLWP